MSPVTILVCSVIAFSSFLFWELVVWYTHKDNMHGLLWLGHRPHHTKHGDFMGSNDLFAIVFSMPVIFLFCYPTLLSYDPYLIALAINMTCYSMFHLFASRKYEITTFDQQGPTRNNLQTN